jgi:hypothetical protein
MAKLMSWFGGAGASVAVPTGAGTRASTDGARATSLMLQDSRLFGATWGRRIRAARQQYARFKSNRES